MSKAMHIVGCPFCGVEAPLLQFFSSEEALIAFNRLVAISIPLGVRVSQYTMLFAAPQSRPTQAKQFRLIQQLLPDLERRAITHKGRDWSVPLEAWAQAIDQMLAARDAGRLELPMKGHGYLYAILAGLSEKHEAAAEAQREQERRTQPQRDTVTVRGQAMSIGDALQVVHGGKDPALAKMDAATREAAPMPAEVRARIAELKKGMP